MERCQTAGIGHDSKTRVRFEPRRNDPLLNNYNAAMILAWRANIDIKPVMSKDAALKWVMPRFSFNEANHKLRSYIAKYATKAEQQAPGFPELLDGVVKQMGNGGTAQSACQKLLNKMLGERTYSAQETAHLLLGIPLVRTSVSFQTLMLNEEGAMRELEDADDDEELGLDEAEDLDGNGARKVTGDSWFQRYKAHDIPIEEKLTKYIGT
jgi:hypothetical protein